MLTQRLNAAMIWAWSLLAAVLAHALIPQAEPIARTRGSAFSASTEDVLVLRPAYAVEIAKRKQAPLPLDPPLLAAAFVSAQTIAVPKGAAPRPVAASAPLPANPARLRPPSRAPPAALV